MRNNPRVAVGFGWFLVLLVVLAGLAAAGNAPTVVLTYFAVWLVSTTFPGVMLLRALCPPTNVGRELGFGSVLGIALLLAAWVPATLLHEPRLMWLLPVTVAVAFAATPGLRRHWVAERGHGQTAPARWHLTMMVVVVLAFLRLWATGLRTEALPPHASTIFQDEWYEIGLAQHLTHTVGLTDPAAAGVPLHYHWFSNADAAATQLLSGAPLPEVVLHMWPVAMMMVFVFAVAGATDRIVAGAGSGATTFSEDWWPGPLAAFIVAAVPVVLALGQPRVPALDNGFVPSSTSGILALTLVLALVGPILDVLHGRRSPGTWIVLCLLLVLSAGTKPSILPVVTCGSALVALVQLLQTRKLTWVPVVLTTGPLLLIPVAALGLTGSTGGSRLQLFATLTLDSSFVREAGRRTGLPGHGGWLTPALASGGSGMWGVAGGLLLLFTLTELPRLVGLLSIADITARTDPGIWWCVGVVGSGYCGLWVLAHPGYSQHYFWRIVIGLGVSLTVASTARLLPRPVRWRTVRTDLIQFGLGGSAAGAVALAVFRKPTSSVAERLLPYAITGITFAVLVLLRRRTQRTAGPPLLALLACFVVASALPPAVADFDSAVGPALGGLPPQPGPSLRYVTRGEQVAAMWLHDHTGADAVVATNVFCSPRPYRFDCPHVSFWLAALTGRQLLIGPWAYTEKSMSAYARQSTSYQTGPSPWPDRLTLSLRAVRSPDRQVISALRARGVAWIYADRRATTVSPKLGRLSRRVFSNRDVDIYRLPDARTSTTVLSTQRIQRR